jgi:hypothetical protein
MAAHREHAQMPVHEGFAHHFRLPRRSEEMAHFLFRYAFAWQTRTAKGLPLSGSPLSLTDLPGVLKDQIIHITHRLFRLHTLPSFAISAFTTYSVYAAEGKKLHETVHRN